MKSGRSVKGPYSVPLLDLRFLQRKTSFRTVKANEREFKTEKGRQKETDFSLHRCPAFKEADTCKHLNPAACPFACARNMVTFTNVKYSGVFKGQSDKTDKTDKTNCVAD